MRFPSIGLWVAAVLALPNIARATEVETHQYVECSREPSEADLTAAKAAFQAGNVSFNEADYPRALLYWEDAFRRDCTAHPLLLNLARAYELDSQRQQAVIALEAFLQREPDSTERAQISRRIEVLKRQIESERAAAPVPAPPPASTPVPGEPEPASQPTAVAPSSSTSARKIVPLAVAGVGGGITVLGLLMYADAHKDVNHYKELCGGTSNCPEELVEPANEAGKRETTGSLVTLGGAAMLAGGVIWFLLTPSTPSKSATVVLPNVAPGFAGVSVDGRF